MTRELAVERGVISRAHPWGPVVVNRAARGEGRLLRVVAFNAHGGGSWDKLSLMLRRPPLTCPDIVLLSEMDWRMRRSSRRETAAELAAELGMSFAYIGEFAVPPKRGGPVSFVGNAILSNRPLADVCVLPLARTITRMPIRRLLGAPAGLAAKMVVNRRVLSLGIVHLNSRWHPSGRELQMRQYLQEFPPGAAIIGGDFNTTTVDLSTPGALLRATALSLLQPRRFHYPQKWEPLFERLREAGFDTADANVSGAGTFTPNRFVPPMVRPKLDWLAVRGVKPVAGSAAVMPARMSWFAPRYSDHDLITCSVEA